MEFLLLVLVSELMLFQKQCIMVMVIITIITTNMVAAVVAVAVAAVVIRYIIKLFCSNIFVALIGMKEKFFLRVFFKFLYHNIMIRIR